jgi:hypothetical protein
MSHAHHALAKKKRDTPSNSKRCKNKPKPKPTTSSSTPAAKATGGSYNNNGNNNNGKTSSLSKPSSSSKPSASPKPSSASTGSSTSSGGSVSSKVGLAWPNGNDPSLNNFNTGKKPPIYTWSPEIPELARTLGFTPIPQLWGDDQVSDFKSKVVKGYANMVLGFNEPNEPGQSNMSPSHGADLWKQYIEPLKNQGYTLISPATSSNPNGKVWMNSFLSSCNGGCTLHGVAIHYYDITPQGFIQYIEDWHNTYNLPVYPTEFACQNFNGGAQCSEDQVHNFMSTITAYMDSADWVPAYFAFGIMKDMQGVNTLNQLMNNNGEPTALGSMYLKGQ